MQRLRVSPQPKQLSEVFKDTPNFLKFKKNERTRVYTNTLAELVAPLSFPLWLSATDKGLALLCFALLCWLLSTAGSGVPARLVSTAPQISAQQHHNCTSSFGSRTPTVGFWTRVRIIFPICPKYFTRNKRVAGPLNTQYEQTSRNLLST